MTGSQNIELLNLMICLKARGVPRQRFYAVRSKGAQRPEVSIPSYIGETCAVKEWSLDKDDYRYTYKVANPISTTSKAQVQSAFRYSKVWGRLLDKECVSATLILNVNPAFASMNNKLPPLHSVYDFYSYINNKRFTLFSSFPLRVYIPCISASDQK